MSKRSGAVTIVLQGFGFFSLDLLTNSFWRSAVAKRREELIDGEWVGGVLNPDWLVS